MIKKYLSLVIIILFINSFVYSEELEDDFTVYNFDEIYSSNDIYKYAKLLEKTYPDIVKVEDIGLSLDNRKIFALLLSENIKNTMNSESPEIEKMNFLVEGGIHSRENVSPNVIMKTIELYIKDYYDDGIISEYNLKNILNKNVIHFIPLSNPDGYDLSTFGINYISYKSRDRLLSLNDTDYSHYKSNLNGVDLNRNFPGVYYDVFLDEWVDIWNVVQNEFISTNPSKAFYHGPNSGSETETKTLMRYIMKYDFRNYLSYHNKGEVIYYEKWMLSDTYNKRELELAKAASYLTGYDMIESSVDSSSSGYMGDYISMNTLKPSITLELLDWRINLPANNKYFNENLNNTLLVPLKFVEIGQEVGYFKYRVYLFGKYFRDFEEEEYANAIKNKYYGKVVEGEGVPKLYLDPKKNYITRIDFIKLLLKNYLFEGVEGSSFVDCDDTDVLNARSLGLVNGYKNMFRPYDFVTFEEVYIVISNFFLKDYELKTEFDFVLKTEKKWVIESIKILVENSIIDYKEIRWGRITLEELENLINGGIYENSMER